mgnify:CR=1 FL=1
MQTVVATSKLIEKRGDIVTTLENRSLLLKKKLAKEREESYQSFKNKLDESKRKNKGRNVLATVATGGAGAAVLNRFRPRRPSVTSGRSSGLRKFNIFRSKPRITGGSRVNTNILRGGSKLNSLLTVAFTGYDFIDRKNRGQTNLQAGAGAVSTSGGAIAGGAAGAAIGTAIFPGVGTVIGGILGSFIGASAGGSLSDSITGANADKKRKEEIKKLATPQASLFSGALDTFDVVLEKFAKLRASDFDRSKREDDRIPLAISRREPGKGGTATKLPPPVPKTPKVPPKDIPNPIVETIKDVGLITLGVGLVVGATVLAGPTGPDDVAAYGTFAAILNKTKLGQAILKNGPKILKALRNADTVKRMNDAIRNKKNFPKLDKANLEKIKKSDKIIKDLRKEGAAEKILREDLLKTLREEKNFNLKFIRTFLRKSKKPTSVERINLLEKTNIALKNMRQGIASRGLDAEKAGRSYYFKAYKKILNAYDKEISKIERAIEFIKKKQATINEALRGRTIKKIQKNLKKNKSKRKSDLFSFSTFEGDNTTNVFNQGPPIALNSGDPYNQINMIELNGYMRQV